MRHHTARTAALEAERAQSAAREANPIRAETAARLVSEAHTAAVDAATQAHNAARLAESEAAPRKYEQPVR